MEMRTISSNARIPQQQQLHRDIDRARSVQLVRRSALAAHAKVENVCIYS